MSNKLKFFISLLLCIFFCKPIFSEDFSSGWKRSRILLLGSAEKNYEVGKWFFKKKDYNSALEHLLKSIKKNKSIDAYRLAAECYVNIYKFKEAQEMAEGALYLSPNSYDLQKLQDSIKSLKHARENTLSEDLNKIAKEHKKTLEKYDSKVKNLEKKKTNLSVKFNSDKNKLEKKYLRDKRILEEEYNNKKKSLEDEYQEYNDELNQEKSKVENMKASVLFAIFLLVLVSVIVMYFIYQRFSSIETKHSSLNAEKRVFEGQKADHQMKIDLELSNVRKLKKDIDNKKNELNRLENSLNDKENFVQNLKKDLDNQEKIILNLKQDLQQEQRDIKKEWDRINSAKKQKGFQNRSSDPYTILDLPFGTTDQRLIKKHWKKMSTVCHPDKIASMHPDLKILAEELMKDVNHAYDSLRILKN